MKRLGLIVGTAFLICAPALAANALDAAARAFRTDPVYVAADADPTISPSEAQALRTVIRRSDTPIFIAILNASAITDADGVDGVPSALARKTGRPGAYGIIAGKNFRAAASLNIGLAPNEAGELATEAFNENHPSTTGGRVLPMLEAWVRAVQTATHTTADAPPASDAQTGNEPAQVPFSDVRTIPTGSTSTIFPILFLLVFVVAGISALVRFSGYAGGGGSAPRGRRSTFDGRRAYYHPGGTFNGTSFLAGWYSGRNLHRSTFLSADPQDGNDRPGGGFFGGGSSGGFDSSAGGGSWGSSSSGDSSSGGSSGFDSSSGSGGGSW